MYALTTSTNEWIVITLALAIAIAMMVRNYKVSQRRGYCNCFGLIGNYTVKLNEQSKYSGTKYPTGTCRKPVNNMKDALEIAEKYKITEIEMPDGKIYKVKDLNDGNK